VHAPLDPATAVKACSDAVVAPEPAAPVAAAHKLLCESATVAVPVAPFQPTNATSRFPALTFDVNASACVAPADPRCAVVA
jgi:hypothetical protein